MTWQESWMNWMCLGYGLAQNDFRNELFEGSKHTPLISRQDQRRSNHLPILFTKATMVLRTQAGKPVYDGEQIQIGGHGPMSPFAANVFLIRYAN